MGKLIQQSNTDIAHKSDDLICKLKVANSDLTPWVQTYSISITERDYMYSDTVQYSDTVHHLWYWGINRKVQGPH